MTKKKEFSNIVFDDKLFKQEYEFFIDTYKNFLKLGLSSSCSIVLLQLYNLFEYDGKIFVDNEINEVPHKEILTNILQKEKDFTVGLEKEFDRLMPKLNLIKGDNSLKFIRTMDILIKDMAKKEIIFKKEEAINRAYLNVKQYCEEITIDDVKGIMDKFGADYKSPDLTELIFDEQERINNIPNITKYAFFEKYPDFKEHIDNSGLVDLSFENYELIKKYNLDGIYYKDYFIYFDNLFLFQGIRSSFLDSFLHFANKFKAKTRCRIRLNFDKIISLDNYRRIMLLEGAHFGPEYNINNLFTDKNLSSLTRKKRLNSKFSENFDNNISYTDFFLDQKNHSFMIEEIGRNPKDGPYLNRLIHSEFDIDKRMIKHFDGSILFYDMDSYEQRENTDLSKYPKLDKKKEKLFQIDGEIPLKEREDLILGYYARNEMVLEYFDFEAYKAQYAHILDYENGTDF